MSNAPASDPPVELSIIVLTFNSAKCVEKCLQYAFGAMEKVGIDGEVVIFENGSIDGTVTLLNAAQSQYGDKLKVLYSEINLGTTRSRNAAIKASEGRFLLVLDSDAFLTPECLRRMHDFLDSHTDYGMVGPRLNYRSGNFQLSYDEFPTLQRKLSRYFFLRGMEQNTEQPQQTIEVDYLISACWLLRKEVFDIVGPLDEEIFYAPEDVDYCLRVWKAGFKIAYLPDVAMVHDAQELSRGIKFNRFVLKHGMGLLYYFKKHGYFWSLSKTKQQIAERVQSRAS
ncbi:glycosyltransferase family 2 protein [Bowmanella yangjiangensis]|uniref:Glycosyltransferase n=1 Tax=Bowmanella yangjiangensis TaxID=2811230 RepID=A0ABS3CTD7_9ALTE|nr:glycosyltransferase [Bowmanella yangjiangensis]MBN7820388.1 glycosyltransferase [Bowmanella yangjiangensis]